MKSAMRLLLVLSVLVGIASPATAGPDAKQFFEQQSRQSGGGM
jgi:TolA-binding protein